MRIERGSKPRRVVFPIVDMVLAFIAGSLIVWGLMSAIDQHMSHIERSRTTTVTKESASHDNKSIHPSWF
jgi:hypothetical protein